MKLSQLEYTLPENLIAQELLPERDHSKLLVLNRQTEEITHHLFYEIENFLDENDVLVLNKTKVFPARLYGKKTDTGGKIEILLIEETEDKCWKVLHKGKIKPGQTLSFNKLLGLVTSVKGEIAEIKFNVTSREFDRFLEAEGATPLPPYINSNASEGETRKQYQTVYAKDRGSVAAPTAGFHFTNELLEKLIKKGVTIEYVTLHVGLGTFLPIHSDDLAKHHMHPEVYSVGKEVAERLNKSKSEGKRIVSVGTTTTRVLETLATKPNRLDENLLNGKTTLFIYPPYKFNFVDALITNFHLPHSTLLALVGAFVTNPNTKTDFSDFIHSPIGKAYEEAIKRNYRFYSFGDASFIY